MKRCSILLASCSDLVGVLASANVVKLGAADAPLPDEICWMPAGRHEISAFNLAGQGVRAQVLCDEAGAKMVAQAYAAILARGYRVFLDKDHKDEEATGWVLGFRWDPAQGIMAKVQWTALGEQLLRGKVYYSFSPAFLHNKGTGRVSGIPAGHAAGGLVNAPAFGAAMPALIAARLAGAESVNPASGGSPGTNPNSTIVKDLIVQILAALAVQVPADANEEQAVALFAKHKDQLVTAAKTNAELQTKVKELEQLQAKQAATNDETVKAKLAELDTLKAKDAARRKADAKAAVDAAVARGALPAKDEAIQAKWLGLIEAGPTHAELLKAMQANPALTRVTTPGAGLVIARDGLVQCLRALNSMPVADVIGRATVYAKDIAPMFKESDFQMGPILAANSLGTLSGELVTQRSLTLLKRSFPALFAISTDFSADNAAFNQTIQTRLRTVPSVTDYDADTGYSTSDATATDVPLTINAHKAVQIAFGVNELGSTKRDLFGENAEGAHNAIGADLLDAILGVITVANFPAANTTTEALADFDRATVTGIAKKLTTRKVPKAGRFLMLNPDYYEKLGQDTSIVSLATYQQAKIITDGELPPVAKMQPYEVESFPTTGNLVGFGGIAAALAVATRVPNDYTAAMPDVPSNGVVQLVTNPDTGITVMLVRFVDHQLGKAFWRLAYMRGAAKGLVAGGERIISAAP